MTNVAKIHDHSDWKPNSFRVYVKRGTHPEPTGTCQNHPEPTRNLSGTPRNLQESQNNKKSN